jgi:hypothetical protein
MSDVEFNEWVDQLRIRTAKRFERLEILSDKLKLAREDFETTRQALDKALKTHADGDTTVAAFFAFSIALKTKDQLLSQMKLLI